MEIFDQKVAAQSIIQAENERVRNPIRALQRVEPFITARPREDAWNSGNDQDKLFVASAARIALVTTNSLGKYAGESQKPWLLEHLVQPITDWHQTREVQDFLAQNSYTFDQNRTNWKKEHLQDELASAQNFGELYPRDSVIDRAHAELGDYNGENITATEENVGDTWADAVIATRLGMLQNTEDAREYMILGHRLAAAAHQVQQNQPRFQTLNRYYHDYLTSTGNQQDEKIAADLASNYPIEQPFGLKRAILVAANTAKIRLELATHQQFNRISSLK